MLWGACDALFTPRALGPLLPVADDAGGALAELLTAGARPHEGVRALIDVHPVVLNAVGMAVGAAALIAGAVVAGDDLALPGSPRRGGRSATWSSAARSACSCSTWWCCADGRRRALRT